METHEFEISIDTTGEVRIQVKGAKGPACERYIPFFEKILSTSAAEIEHTSEYYEPPTGIQINLEDRL